jgi:hypothetical protein
LLQLSCFLPYSPNRCLLLRFEDQLNTTCEKENATSVKDTVGGTCADVEIQTRRHVPHQTRSLLVHCISATSAARSGSCENEMHKTRGIWVPSGSGGQRSGAGRRFLPNSAGGEENLKCYAKKVESPTSPTRLPCPALATFGAPRKISSRTWPHESPPGSGRLLEKMAHSQHSRIPGVLSDSEVQFIATSFNSDNTMFRPGQTLLTRPRPSVAM